MIAAVDIHGRVDLTGTQEEILSRLLAEGNPNRVQNAVAIAMLHEAVSRDHGEKDYTLFVSRPEGREDVFTIEAR